MSALPKLTLATVRLFISLVTPDRRQSKTLILSTNVDKISLEKEFSFTICGPTDDKWQSKTLFLAIFDPRIRRLLRAFSIAAYPVFYS